MTAVILLLCMSLPQAGDDPALRPETRQAFAWFDGLGFPDLAKCRLVRVATGETRHDEPGPRNTYRVAFLVSDDGGRFTVFDLRLDTVTYTKSGPGKKEFERVGYEPLELATETRALLKGLRTPEDEAFQRRFGLRVGEPAELLLWARTCAAHGQGGLAEEVAAAARQAAVQRQQTSLENRNLGFVRYVEEEIATHEMYRAVTGFGDLNVSRKDLLARFVRIALRFPQSEHAERARRSAMILRKMVAEDEEHARKPAKPLEQLGVQERVAELIFRLRDQHGGQFSNPGSCDVFSEDRFAEKGAPRSPAQQLVDIGYDAVPQLIAALEDERFSRSVGFHRSYYFSHFVLRVGDCAEAALERIAARMFWEPRSSSAAMLKDGDGPATRARVEAWWREFQKKGEKQMLIEGTEKGDYDATLQAERLVQKYPDAALEPLKTAARRAASPDFRARFLRLAAGLPGDRPLVLLRDELRGRERSVRIEAARLLLDRSPDEAVRAMVAEWAKPDDGPDQGDLIAFMLWNGRPETVREVARTLRARPVGTRLQVLESIRGPVWHGNWEANRKALPAAAALAVDELLLAELDDPEVTGGRHGWGLSEAVSPRLGDLAALVFAERLGPPAQFDLAGTRRTRDRQQVELKNLWRQHRGMAALPLPAARRVMPLPDERVQPLLTRLEAAPIVQEREAALKSVLALGLPALPAVRTRVRSLNPEHPARGTLAELATRLAWIVGEVRFAPESLPPEPALRQRLEALKGQPPDPRRLVDLLNTAIALPSGDLGAEIAVDRAGDDAGAELIMTLRRTKATQPGNPRGWGTLKAIAVGGKALYTVSDCMSQDYGATPANWLTFARQFNTVLQRPPEETVTVRVALLRGD